MILAAAITFWWEPPILEWISIFHDQFSWGSGPWPILNWFLLFSSTVALCCLWLCLWRNSRRSLGGLVLLSAVIVTPSAYVYYRLITPLPIPEVTLPEPNGYQALVEAGIAIECRAINFYDTTPIDVLASEVASREELYVKARNAPKQQVVVPVSYGIEDIDTDASGALRTLCRALAAQARVAIEQGDYDEALKCNSDIYRLGQKCSTNGLFIHWLIGSAIKGVGLSRIYNMRDHLSSEQCLSTIRELAETEETPQLYQNRLHRERVWTEQTGGFYGHLTLILEDVAGDQRWAETRGAGTAGRGRVCEHKPVENEARRDLKALGTRPSYHYRACILRRRGFLHVWRVRG